MEFRNAESGNDSGMKGRGKRGRGAKEFLFVRRAFESYFIHPVSSLVFGVFFETNSHATGFCPSLHFFNGKCF